MGIPPQGNGTMTDYDNEGNAFSPIISPYKYPPFPSPLSSFPILSRLALCLLPNGPLCRRDASAGGQATREHRNEESTYTDSRLERGERVWSWKRVRGQTVAFL